MRSLLLATLPAALLACGDPLPPPAPPPLPSASPVAPPSSAPTVSASAAPEAPPGPPAKLGAPVDGKLGEAVVCKAEGFASLHVWPIGKGLLGVCGMAVHASGTFWVPETGPVRAAPEVFKDVSISRAREGSLLGINGVRGPDIEHLEADIGEILSRSGVSYRFRKDGKSWKQVSSYVFEGGGDGGGCWGSCVELNGKALFEQKRDGERRFEYAGKPGGWLPARGKLAGCDEPVSGFNLLWLQGKTLWGVGGACGKGAVQRWTVGGKDTSVAALDVPVTEENAQMIRAEGKYVYIGDLRAVALFDGERWTPLVTLAESASIQVHFGGGRIWIQIGNALHRVEGDKLVAVPVPDGGAQRVRVSDTGELRLWTGKGLYSLDREDVWHPITIPAGATDSQDMEWIGGRFTVRASGGTDGAEQHLYIEGVTGPALRIIDPNGAVSPMAFVRPLDRECEKPFAMLYKLSRVAPKDYDFPATKKALAGHPVLQAGRFSEVTALGDRYLVARFEGPRARERLADLARLVQKEVQGAKPQLLCADAVRGGLPTTRDIPMK